jgi:hypothetical protein
MAASSSPLVVVYCVEAGCLSHQELHFSPFSFLYDWMKFGPSGLDIQSQSLIGEKMLQEVVVL